MLNTYWIVGLLLAMLMLGAALYWLRGALYRFVDDGGLYSTYNGEQPYVQPGTSAHARRTAQGTKPRRKLTLQKV